MGGLEDVLGCTFNLGITKMNLNISQPHIITNTIEVFNEDVKSRMTLNTTAPHKGIVRNR